MTPSDSLSGLIKWLAKEPWRTAYLGVLDDHIGPILEAHEIPDFDELGGLIGLDYAMTLWGCAFEDFLTRDVEGAGFIVDDYLKRRGWKESVGNRAYIAGLKDSVMSLYEVSDIEPGRSFRARDLIHGSEAVRISERTATKTLKPWDRVAMRVVEVRGKMIIGGGLLPFEIDLSEQFLAATNQSDLRSNLGPQLSQYFLAHLIDRIVDPVTPRFANSDGEDMEFMRIVYRLAQGVTAKHARSALNQIPDLEAASETVWQWLEPRNAQSQKQNVDQSHGFELVTMNGGGFVVLGTIELKPKTIELSVNSESRADRGQMMLGAFLRDLLGPPLVERQTLEQAFSEDHGDGSGSAISDLAPDEERSIIHDSMDRHYRAQLDQPIPALGNMSPRKAAKSKKGREKVVAWLKRLENQNAGQDTDHPMASYDATWIWDELGVSSLRK